MKLLANKVHIQGMEVLLADRVHKQERQCVAIHFSHATIPSDGCMCETCMYSHTLSFLFW